MFRCIRRFASTAPAVPLQLHGIDGRYASSLFAAAKSLSKLPQVEADLGALSSLFARDPQVKEFLENPLINRRLKIEGLGVILREKTDPLVVNFMHLLAENGRGNLITKILASFEQLMRASRGEVSIVVTSAKTLDAKTVTKLKDVLSKGKFTTPGQKLMIDNKVDPQIIGGIVIEFGDKTIDMSISSKLTKMNNLLSQAV